MAFKDLADALDLSAPIALPIMGEVVEFPGVISARAGMLLLAVMDAARSAAADDALDAEAAAALAESSLGEADAQYIEAQILGDAVARLDELCEYNGRRRSLVTNTLIVWHTQGQAAAELFWNAGGEQGKAQQPNRATRRAKAGPVSTTDGGQPPRLKAQPRATRAAGGSSATRRRTPAAKRTG